MHHTSHAHTRYIIARISCIDVLRNVAQSRNDRIDHAMIKACKLHHRRSYEMYRAVKFSQMYSSDGTTLTALHSDRATFLDVLSETDSAAALKNVARELGLAFHAKSVKVTGNRQDREMPVTSRVIELVEREVPSYGRDGETYPVYLAWLALPEIHGLPARARVSDDVSDDEMNAFREIVNDYELGVGQFGDDENGDAVIALSSHAFFGIGPALGYSVAAMCKLYGGTENSITFDDQVFYCSGCSTLQEDSTGYEYRFREVNGELYGTACGCAAEAETENLDEFVNEAERALSRAAAQKLTQAGTVEFVARYIGGWTDPGRGGWYDGARVENGEPSKILAALQTSEPDAGFVFAMDEAGQFQVYFSVYRVITSKDKVA